MKRILIAIAVYDTEQNDRTKYTKETYASLLETVDFETTQVVFINNASCKETVDFLKLIETPDITVLHNDTNLGTAEAINLGWRHFSEIPYKVKLDNDVVFHTDRWADLMADVMDKMPEIGILGVKRKDLPNSPTSKEYPTVIDNIQNDPKILGNPSNIIEYCDDIIGTGLMFNPQLLSLVGYLWQPGVYGFDDVIICHKSRILDFKNAFYPYIDIDHIDDGKNPFTDWKKRYAGMYLSKIEGIIDDYIEGKRPLYYNPFG